MSRSERGVTTQRYLNLRSEPSQGISIAVALHESRLREVHFGSYGLHPVVRDIVHQSANGSGIPAEWTICESVHVPAFDWGHSEPTRIERVYQLIL